MRRAVAASAGGSIRRWRAALIAALAAALLLQAPPAQAQTGDESSNRLVTIAARSCPAYSDIAANRARNNIQESLRDLGADSLYVGGEAIKPSKELQQQPDCVPLPNWEFKLGSSYQTRAVNGTWGSMSRVTSAFPRGIVTRDAVPLLDLDGQRTGRTIPGAVTIELTPEEARLAVKGNGLWLQGGLPDDPVLDRRFPGRYGFGALRCTIDNLNGDNVEFVSFPQGSHHVFCFAYYVTPPPTSGSITVRKVVDSPDATAATPFRFTGNISYTEDHDFTLSAGYGRPASETFFRAATGPGDDPWTFAEDDQPGWERTRQECVSELRTSSAEVSGSGAIAVRLAAGDFVVCTVHNELRPVPAGLVLSKVTYGGVGTFPFQLSGPQEARTRLTTTDEGVPVSGELSLAGGEYRLDETLPAGAAGSWSVEDVICGGRSLGGELPLAIALRPGEGSSCLVANRFTPSGSITLRKTTLGATGTAGFLIRPDGANDDGDTWIQSARTSAAGVPALARGDDSSALPLGTYEIVESNPTARDDGSWALDSIVCDGLPVGSAQGRVEVTLTAANPDVDCTFVNRFTDTPDPPLVVPPPVETPTPPEQPPTTPPTGSGDIAGVVAANGPTARLSISKRVSPRVVRTGQRVRYTIVVANRGPNAARKVTAVEVRPPHNRILSVRTTRGRCATGRRPLVCRIGRLGVGRRVTITVVTRAGRPGRHVNRVAVNAATTDPNLRDNRAAARVRVLRPLPRFTG